MKCSMPGSALANALGVVMGVVPRRAARPILQGVLMKCASPSDVTLIGTDMEIGVRERVVGVVDQEGEALVPAARLFAIVKELADVQVELTYDKGKLDIRSAGVYFQLVCDDATDFPQVPEVPTDGRVTIPGPIFGGCIARTSFAASLEETRYAIHGVLLEVEKDCLRLVATDGKRLAVAEHPVVLGVTEKQSALLPVKALTMMARGWGDTDWTIDLVFEDKRVLAQAGDTTIIASRIEGTFPSWEEVLPTIKTHAELSAEAFASCVRRGALVATEGSHAVSLEFANGQLTVGARASNLGEATIVTEATWPGDPITVHFNPKYLVDYLKILDTAHVLVGMNDSRSAVLLEGKAVEGGETPKGSFRYVLMPITIDGEGRST